jgi:hypothetical protein
LAAVAAVVAVVVVLVGVHPVCVGR